MATVVPRVRNISVLVAAWLGICVAVGAVAQQIEDFDQRSPSLTFLYEKPSSPELEKLFETLRDSRILESWTGYVNRILDPLPHRIEAAFAECGKAKSWYDPRRERITLCYEEADRSFRMLNLVGYETETQLLTSWIGSMLFELYHELGHALVDMLWLPVLGKEEDGADQFAVIVLLGHPEGWELVLGNSDYFHQMAAIETDLGPDPAHGHPFFSQRYYNILCLTYGSDPEKHNVLATDGRLPKARAESCRLEYERAAYGWGALLKPVGKLKPSIGTTSAGEW